MKPLSEYRKDGDYGYHYEDDRGAHYDTLEDFLQIHVLGFCGCGNPIAVLNLIHDLCLLKERWSNNDNCDWKVYDELRTKYLLENMDSVKWFFDYYLEKQEFTTHGGNVSGSWIDDQNFLEAIKIWHAEWEKENDIK